MNDKIPSKISAGSSSSGVPVQVQCDDFKCMAYRDKDGKWRDFFTRELLPRVLGPVPSTS